MFSIVKSRDGRLCSFLDLPVASIASNSRAVPPPSIVILAWGNPMPLPASCDTGWGLYGSFVCRTRQSAAGPQAFGVNVTLMVARSPGLMGAVGQLVTVKGNVSSPRPLHFAIAQLVTRSGALPVL